ncbi:hypothetical protein BCEN4_310010 [Burkholderia cenocepacia]|nr:hypothetical protein BCEN4_310010 [Burkholderia cenocepacia]
MGQGAWPAVSYPIGFGTPARVPVPAVRHASGSVLPVSIATRSPVAPPPHASYSAPSSTTPKTAPIMRVTFISDAAVLTRAVS